MPLDSFVDFERALWPSFAEDEGVPVVFEDDEPGLEVSDEILSTTLLRKPGFEGSSVAVDSLAAPLT